MDERTTGGHEKNGHLELISYERQVPVPVPATEMPGAVARASVSGVVALGSLIAAATIVVVTVRTRAVLPLRWEDWWVAVVLVIAGMGAVADVIWALRRIDPRRRKVVHLEPRRRGEGAEGTG